MHYFSPVDKMELLEIVRAKKTSDDTVRAAVSVGLKQGKVVIVVGDGPGFYTTRLLMFAGAEVFRLLQEGVSPKDIDKATKNFGFPVGSATLFDEVGIDVAAHIARDMHVVFGDRLTDASMPALFQELVRNNLHGRKSGQGLYIYQAGVKGGNRELNPKFQEIIKNYALPSTEQSVITRFQSRSLCSGLEQQLNRSNGERVYDF
jgi:enoyl-CoA hydratase / long-chain 3-hydroxyacyl-CoA dehydrogenase